VVTRRTTLKRNYNTPPPSTESTHEERDHRALDRLVQDLSTHLPHFRSPQSSITVLKEPSQFYLELLVSQLLSLSLSFLSSPN
jgi:hypothetical protein